MKRLLILVAALPLSGCGMLLTINPIGMLGIIERPHYRHVSPPPCHPYPQCHIVDTGMKRGG